MIFKVDLREPYLGNTVPIHIEVTEGGKKVRVWTEEHIIHTAKPIGEKDHGR